jgi:hypothetical protein
VLPRFLRAASRSPNERPNGVVTGSSDGAGTADAVRGVRKEIDEGGFSPPLEEEDDDEASCADSMVGLEGTAGVMTVGDDDSEPKAATPTVVEGCCCCVVASNPPAPLLDLQKLVP